MIYCIHLFSSLLRNNIIFVLITDIAVIMATSLIRELPKFIFEILLVFPMIMATTIQQVDKFHSLKYPLSIFSLTSNEIALSKTFLSGFFILIQELILCFCLLGQLSIITTVACIISIILYIGIIMLIHIIIEHYDKI